MCGYFIFRVSLEFLFVSSFLALSVGCLICSGVAGVSLTADA